MNPRKGNGKMADSYEFELEALRGELFDLRRAISSLSMPSVNGKAGAFVALAKDSRLDGRIGAGDVTVSVLLATGGACIGAIGAGGIWVGGGHIVPASTGEFFTLSTMVGCGLGLGRMALDALAVPMMFSNALDWLEDRWHEWLEQQRETSAGEPQIIEHPLIINGREQAKPGEVYTSTDYADRYIVIKEETGKSKPVTWTYARLWYFIEDCFRTGEWSRRKVCARWNDEFGEGTISQSEHGAISNFLQAKAPGLWGLTGERNRPTLEAYLKRFRWSPTNQPVNQPTNRGEQ